MVDAPQLGQRPHITPWKDAYKAFGATPKKHLSSVENLAARALKGQELAPLVRLLIFIILSLSSIYCQVAVKI